MIVKMPCEITFKSAIMSYTQCHYTTYMLTLTWKARIGLCKNNRGNGNQVEELLGASQNMDSFYMAKDAINKQGDCNL